MAGWAHSVRRRSSSWRFSASAWNTGRGNTVACRLDPPMGRSAARSHAPRATSRWMATSPPMPTYCDPWPGNRNATLPGCSPAWYELPVGRWNGSVGAFAIRSASCSSFWRSSRSSEATTDRRAGSAGSALAWVEVAANFRNPGSVERSARARALPASSAGVAADNTTSSAGNVRSRGAWSAGPVYSSSDRWKLLPPNPNELTLARRGWSEPRIQGRDFVFR